MKKISAQKTQEKKPTKKYTSQKKFAEKIS